MKSRFADEELTHTNLPETAEPLDYDRWLATYIKCVGPLDAEGVPEYLVVELWRGQSANQAPKKLKTIKYTRTTQPQ